MNALPKTEQLCPQCYRVKAWPENFIGARGLPVGMCTVCRETYQSPGGWRSMTLAERAAIPRRSVPAYPELRAKLYPNSKNTKLGGIPASVTSRGTCPPSCSFYQAGCFATYGKQAHHWRVVGESGDSWGQFLEDVRGLPAGQLWRHNVAGDLPGDGETVDGAKLLELAVASSHTRAFTFSHKHAPENRAVIATAVDVGFAINLSADSLEQADTLADLEIAPVAVVLPSDAPDKGNVTPKGRKILVCPAERVAGITCARCGVCAKTERHALVGFRAHGQASAY
ncbi:MAG TPA: hypothetical protein VN894_09565, partial [Polyangiaceae bacterium]|nr:hypothetical protein [Polyangiaceae bacterium]